MLSWNSGDEIDNSLANIRGTEVQDHWERSFKELGEENPEQTTTGLLLFYPHHLVGYMEVRPYFSTNPT